MPNLRDLMLPEDALDLEERYSAILRERNEYEDRLGESFREVQRREIFDWEVEIPEFEF